MRADSMLQNGTTAAVVLLMVLIVVRMTSKRLRRQADLPPSPRGLPIIGHLHLIPEKLPWFWYHRLAQDFKSPLTYLNLLGQEVVLINDYQAAIDILEKRSASYSSRQRMVVIGDYVSENKRILFLPYGDVWRIHRGAFHRHLTPQKLTSYLPIQYAEVKKLMRALLHSPEAFEEHFTHFTASVLVKICYGSDSEDETRQAIHGVEEVLVMFKATTLPGANLVDLFPSLDRLPDFLSPWRKAAFRQRQLTQDVYGGLARQVRDRVAKGQLRLEGAFTADLWKDKEKLHMDELDIALLAGSMFEAGIETTSASLVTFVFIMVMHPDVFVAAQQEIDRICGERPPEMEDMENMPYVRAVFKELMRWRPVAPQGMPHLATTTEDDYYQGMRIPAGALVIPNQYSMGLSQSTFGQKYDADIFEPRRWLDRPEGVGDIFERDFGFGFGRRVCPGKHLAVQSLFMVIANLCYWFDIKAKPGVVLDAQRFTTALTTKPEPFECIIVPREEREQEIEKQAEATHETL